MVVKRLASWTSCAWMAGALVACVHRPPPTEHFTRLMVESSSKGVIPRVRVMVSGHPTTLLLDTGSFRSMLSWRFAQAHGLTAKARDAYERVVDATGNTVGLAHLFGVPVQFEGEASGDAIEFYINPALADDGILAPQDLVQPGWALIIDLGEEELRYEREEAALKRVREGSSGPVRKVDFHRCLNEGLFQNYHRIVSATINGVSTDMLIDTGASHTALTRNNPALSSMLQMKGNRDTVTAMTSTGAVLIVNDVPVVLSETSFTVPVIVSPHSSTCWQGALGADLLRHCTLIWGSDSLWTACRAPE
jgi:hypothetical protein